MIEIAKEKIFDTSKSISDIAFELGFKYPQYFTRMFKKQVGVSPLEYRSMNLTTNKNSCIPGLYPEDLRFRYSKLNT